MKPNRGDALCLVGLAREVSATTGAPVRFPVIELVESGMPTADSFAVENREPELCTRFVGRIVRGFSVGPSPDQVQMRLQAAGMRPVSNVVDASNYVMLELGKPTHTFDLAAVHERRIVVRRAAPGERLVTLDHVERILDPETLLIADPVEALGIAGVMGGATSEVSDTTTEIVIESAIFDPVSIRRTGQRYALRSEASLRFEKGQEVRLARIGADRVAQLVVAWAGGEVAPGRVDTAPVEPEPARVPFRPARVNRLLGTDLAGDAQSAFLARVEVATEPAATGTTIPVARGSRPLDVPADGPALTAIVPTWRADLAIEADIAEEVARVAGYETIEPTLPDTPMPPYRPDPMAARDVVREALAGAGVTEVVTYALVEPARAAIIRWPGDPGSPPEGEGAAACTPITVTNPLSASHSVLRGNVVGSLLDVVDANQRRGRDDVAIFEIGKGYGRLDSGPTEWWRLGLALTGAAEPASWNRAARAYDLDDAKGLVELVADELGMPAVTYEAATDGYPFHPGRAAIARAGDRLIGRVGEVHPELIAALDLRPGRIVVAELAVAGLSGGEPPVVQSRPVSRHQAVERDLAVVVHEAQPAATVEAIIRDAAGDLLTDLRLFDIYRGAPLGADEKSLAFRLRFQADRTLAEAEVEAAVAAVVGALQAQGARLRS